MKSVGADSDAATVCPTSTLREMTTPSMGEMMFVYERLTCGLVQLRRAPARGCAFAASIVGVASSATLASAVSRSACAARFCVVERPWCARSCLSASSAFACAVGDAAPWPAGSWPAPAATAASKSCGSIFATSCALLHRRVEVGVELLDAPGDLGADLHGDDRRERPARGDACPRCGASRPARSCTTIGAAAMRRCASASSRRPRRRAAEGARSRGGVSSCRGPSRPSYHWPPMSTEHPLIVVNPRSGGGRAGRTFTEVRAVLERRLGPLDVALTASPGHAIELARDASRGGHAARRGGRGRRDAARGRQRRARRGGETRPRSATWGRARAATSARRSASSTASTPTSMPSRAGASVRVDAGRADATARPTGSTQQRWFVNILSAGMGGLVDRYVSETTKALGGKAAYFWASTRALGRVPARQAPVRRRPWRAIAQERTLDTFMIAICNGRYFGSGMHVAPMAKPDDGRFEVVSMDAPGKLAFATFSRRIYDGSAPDGAGSAALRVRPHRDRHRERGRAGRVPAGRRWRAARGAADRGGAGEERADAEGVITLVTGVRPPVPATGSPASGVRLPESGDR